MMYHLAISTSFSDNTTYVGGATLFVNTSNVPSSKESKFLSGWLNIISMPSKWSEHQVKHSWTTEASTMDPSGAALFLTNCFKEPKYLRIESNSMWEKHG